MNQREIWENIAPEWSKYRIHPRTEVVDFLRNKKGLILDLACANGRNFVAGKQIIGIDFSQNMLKYAKKHGEPLVLGDIVDLPFLDNTFDTVLMVSILPSIKQNKHKKVMKEVVRVSKDRANVFISAWNKDQPRFANARKEAIVPWKSKLKEFLRYYYLYSPDELEALMKKSFTNVRIIENSKNIIATAKVRKN